MALVPSEIGVALGRRRGRYRANARYRAGYGALTSESRLVRPVGRVHIVASVARLRCVRRVHAHNAPRLVVEVPLQRAPSAREYGPVESCLRRDVRSGVPDRASGAGRHALRRQVFDGDRVEAVRDAPRHPVRPVRPDVGESSRRRGELGLGAPAPLASPGLPGHAFGIVKPAVLPPRPLNFGLPPCPSKNRRHSFQTWRHAPAMRFSRCALD